MPKGALRAMAELPPTPDLDGNPSHLDPADTAVLDQQADFLRFIGTHWTNSSASNPSIRRHIARRQLAWRFDQNGKAKLQSSPYPILDLRRLVPATDPIKLTIPFRLRGWGGTNTAQISLSGPDDAALVSVALMLKDTSVDGSYVVGLGPRNRCRTPSCRRPARQPLDLPAASLVDDRRRPGRNAGDHARRKRQ